MKIVINPKYEFLKDFIRDLPAIFAEEGEIIYAGRNILKRFQVQGIDLVVKSFRIPILINRIAYTFFRKSKAARSYEFGLEIIRRGCDTAEPIAYLEEYIDGLLNRSYYVSIYEKETETVRAYMSGSVEGNEDMLTAFTRFTVSLHQKGIFHIDYSPGNILMKKEEDGEYSFCLVDINRLKFCEIRQNTACHNLERLCSSEEVSSWIAREYAGLCGFNPEEMVRLVNLYSDRFFDKKIHSFARHDIRQSSGVWKSWCGPLQAYILLRFFRRFCHCNLFYKKEKAIYNAYIRICDLRKVRLKEYLR